jgi:hypothetical protein
VGLDIHAIILQLVSVSLPHDKLDRDEHIRNLTPINGVSMGPTPQGEPEFSFYVSKIEPKGSKYIYSDLKTTIVSKTLYPYYMEMSEEEFIRRFNKTIYEHICVHFNQAQKKNVPDSENIWFQPNITFVNWFQENGIDIDSIQALVKDINAEPIEKEDWDGTLYNLADEMRFKKENHEVETYEESYKYGEDHYTYKGKPVIANKLKRAYHKAKSEGKLD